MVEHANEQLSQKQKLIGYRGHHSILLQVETTSYLTDSFPFAFNSLSRIIVSSSTSESLHTLQVKANIKLSSCQLVGPKQWGNMKAVQGKGHHNF